MTHSAFPTFTAAMAQIDLPQGAEVPEWVHLLPAAQGEIRTFDGRGPYRVTNPAAIIAASFSADPRDQNGLIIDENHSSMLGAPLGLSSPARGKIVAMEARADGVWGKVDWSETGRTLLAERAYRGISPVVIHDKSGAIVRIKNAALVNYPNLRELTALNQETSMSFMAQLAERLGLPANSTEAAVLAAIPAAATATALQSAMSEIGLALGVEGGDGAAILAAARSQSRAQPAELVAMQAEMASMATELNTLKTAGKRKAAETFVDGAIAQVRAGVKPQRDRFIAMHMADPTATEELIAGLPSLGAGAGAAAPTSAGGEIVSLNAEQIAVARQLGVSEDAYLKTLKAERQKETV